MIYLGRAKRALTVQVRPPSPPDRLDKTQPTTICAKFNANRIKENVAKRQQATITKQNRKTQATDTTFSGKDLSK